MKKLAVTLIVATVLVITGTSAASKTINETDTELCETLKYALINSLREPIDKAINEIYKDDQEAPEGLSWASFQTEILKIRQLDGIGGTYEITFKVNPYYRAHITYGEDKVVVNSDGELIGYKHLKTYPKVHFN
ncbi:DUF3888 domain-containing protein [Bacillus badius]|uniref:DUF3888 domain-containing protein n=1 Tax=Bacillus badius TaxID=1455 RepID=A0ABR5ARB3_BACBA|nr:DUF3888 domain-containing protein [Bacillus badius]KIL73832.1 hypothetical protein SD78_2890 [Bacillus badius]KIL77184.1 hypothetical protein SD77_1631 [Bacillus badius]KZO00900.1 hypothetical protein A4244_14385 [Bacillus badius]MED0668034.1 DUF3888 domain-containing protein [Bacillus badius]MED4717552.1 DUF3888 domain-containing protein [Bacillus badius]